MIQPELQDPFSWKKSLSSHAPQSYPGLMVKSEATNRSSIAPASLAPHTPWHLLFILGSLLAGAACNATPTPAEPTPVYSEPLPQASPVTVERLSINEPEAREVSSQKEPEEPEATAPKSMASDQVKSPAPAEPVDGTASQAQ